VAKAGEQPAAARAPAAAAEAGAIPQAPPPAAGLDAIRAELRSIRRLLEG
jgi:hypothetical protein